MPRELLHSALARQRLDGIITLRLRGKGVSVEGPAPPLMKIDDDVEGVEGEGMLTLKSMR